MGVAARPVGRGGLSSRNSARRHGHEKPEAQKQEPTLTIRPFSIMITPLQPPSAAPGERGCAQSLGVIMCMTFLRLYLAAILCSAANPHSAAPISDLSSPSQQVRDDATKVLRDKFSLPPRARWESTLAAVKPGVSKESVLKLLNQFNVTLGGITASGQTFTESYRLDDAWELACSYQRVDSAETVIKPTRYESLRDIWVAPPPDFTGVWTTYFVNGQQSREIHYVSGHYCGVFTAFHSEGSKSCVQHDDSSGANGEDTGYFPSGRVSYHARYKNGSPVGTWTHDKEDGSVLATTKHPEP